MLLEDRQREDSGDGLFVLVPPDCAEAPLVEVLPGALVEAVRGHNDTSPARSAAGGGARR
ncbi:hypothetical protein Q5530_26655 [Saccharothrix sp. BKS2]|uniref:hypothetical protein n=1 Tax=Saccharothrix sp. BKS2 TaxID=3064400 RepID=UPI0039E7D5CD